MKCIIAIIFLFTCAFTINGNAQTYTHKINDAEIAGFFAWRMNPATHRVNEEIIPWDSARFYRQLFNSFRHGTF